MNPYQGLKLVDFDLEQQKITVTMPMNPYQGLKRIAVNLAPIHCRHNANESLSGIETGCFW